MESQEQNKFKNSDWDSTFTEFQNRHHRGKIFGGIILFLVGAAFLAREMGAYFPEWLFSWQMLLIIIGLYVGIKHSFRNISWLVLMLIGGAFLLEDFVPGMHLQAYFWPIIIMLIGLFMIFRPRRRFNAEYYRNKWERKLNRRWDKHNFSACANEQSSSSEDLVEMEIVFSSFKKNVISKDFKGGTISSVFGGGKLNLSQADINGKVVIEIKSVFSGIKIIVPAHWEIQTEVVSAVFGGVEDKRPQQTIVHNAEKILVLKGNVVFGGIEIQNY